jgi:hypothetical protein
VKYGFVLPWDDPRVSVSLAVEAEEAGWDGVFVPEAPWSIDAWVVLSTVAALTNKVRLGTLLSPLSRMRPWELASKAATLHSLSGGRVILSVGLGAVDTGFAEFGEAIKLRTRAELMDEGLDIVTGLWRGQPFSYQGKHYAIDPLSVPGLAPPPALSSPIPIWLVGVWPRERSMRRTLRYDGLLPQVVPQSGAHPKPTPEDIAAMRDYAAVNRETSSPFDIVFEGETTGNDPAAAAATVLPYAEAGATWWIEARWNADAAEVEERVRQGPPRGLSD